MAPSELYFSALSDVGNVVGAAAPVVVQAMMRDAVRQPSCTSCEL
jgi:hypothetical protein